MSLVAITDHESIEACIEFQKKWPEISLLPGIEVTCDEGDFLIFCMELDRLFPLQDKGLKSIQHYKRDNDVAIVWAHPLTRRFGEEDGPFSHSQNLEKVMDSIDGIEVYNGNVMTRVAIGQEPESYPERMINLAEKYNKAVIGASDSHNFYSFLSCWTEVPDELATPEGIIRAIKQQLTVPKFDRSYYEKITKTVYPGK